MLRLQRRSRCLRRHVAYWLSAPCYSVCVDHPGLPGRHLVTAQGLDGVPQAAGGGAGDTGRDGAARGTEGAWLPAALADLLLPGARAAQPLAGFVVGPPAVLLGLVNRGGARLLLQQPPAPPERNRRAERLVATRLAIYFPAVSDLAIYCRDPSTHASLALAPCWRGKLRNVDLSGGVDLEPLLQTCPALTSLDLSKLYCWTEDDMLLDAHPTATARLTDLDPGLAGAWLPRR